MRVSHEAVEIQEKMDIRAVGKARYMYGSLEARYEVVVHRSSSRLGFVLNRVS